MAAAPDRPARILRLGSLEDVVASVPHMLGFQPRDSVVAVALTGPRGRMGFSVRLDLLPEEYDADVAAAVSAHLEHAGADAALLFVYTGPPVGGDLPRRPLVEQLQRRLAVPVQDAVLVTDARIWSYLCSDECCPPEGRPLDAKAPGATAIAAAHALEGRAVLPSREALVRSVAPIGGIAAASMDQAIERAAASQLSVGEQAFSASAATLFSDLLERFATAPADVTHDEAAMLIVGLHDIVLRDGALADCLRDLDAARWLFTQLARRAIPPLDAPVCTVLGFVAYAQGDGVIATTALERALDSEPGYALAELLLTALRGQVPPDEIRRAARSSARTRARPVPPRVPRPRRSARRR